MKRKEGRPITMEGFYSLLHDYNSSVIDNIRKLSSEILKLSDSLRLSRELIKSMQENAGTQLLSDDELEIYEKTYSIVYELYDKIEKEIEQIIKHQAQIHILARQLKEQSIYRDGEND
jgi:division protein CdvB (Snf7/Vps24/ESCRT-III family)